LKYLETTTPVKVDDPLIGVVGTLLQAFGLTEVQVADLDLARCKPTEIVDILKGAVEDHVKPKAPRQQAVQPAMVGPLLAQGWLFAGILANGEVILTAP
jgi:hypothetical protein